jgi:hypothetical protein
MEGELAKNKSCPQPSVIDGFDQNIFYTVLSFLDFQISMKLIAHPL